MSVNCSIWCASLPTGLPLIFNARAHSIGYIFSSVGVSAWSVWIWPGILTQSLSFVYTTWASFQAPSYVDHFSCVSLRPHSQKSCRRRSWVSRWVLGSLKMHYWRWFSRTTSTPSVHKGDSHNSSEWPRFAFLMTTCCRSAQLITRLLAYVVGTGALTRFSPFLLCLLSNFETQYDRDLATHLRKFNRAPSACRLN